MTLAKTMLFSAAALGTYAVITTGVVAYTQLATRERVEQRERQIEIDKLHKLISPSQYDNELDKDIIFNIDQRLGTDTPVKIYRARKQKQPVAAIISSIAPNGYSGKIHLLVAVHYDGTLIGVRVVKHKETPGLGDPIEEHKSRWIFSFDGKSLHEPPPTLWKVRKDQGQFDQITSATITSRAVVKAVYNTLLFYSEQRETIFNRPAANLASQR